METGKFDIYFGQSSFSGSAIDVDYTSIILSVPDRTVAIEIGFSFTDPNQTYYFDVFLPYSIIVDGAPSYPEVRPVGWLSLDDFPYMRATFNVFVVPEHNIWSIEYAPNKSYWKEKALPYKDVVLIKGKVERIINQEYFSKEVLTLNLFSLTYEDFSLPNLALDHQGELPVIHPESWPVSWYSRSSCSLFIEFEGNKEVSDESFPPPIEIKSRGSHKFAKWLVAFGSKSDIYWSGYEIKCSLKNLSVAPWIELVKRIAEAMILSPIMVPLNMLREKYRKPRRHRRVYD
jgi:hypothetical protein